MKCSGVMLGLIIAGLVQLGAVTANAVEKDKKYYTISSVSVKSLGVTQDTSVDPMGFLKADMTVGEVIAVADQLIAFGEKIYKIIEKGKPVVTTSYEPISVIPKVNGQMLDPMWDLENWSYPMSRKYQATFKNGYGMKVVDFIFSVNATYGGQYNGKGRYLTGVQIVPQTLSVAWGYNMDATMKLVNIANYGSKKSPIAGATVMLSYRVKTVVKDYQENLTYAVTGDGKIIETK